MLNSIVYVLAFAAALSVVAMCLEHLATGQRRPRRFAWILAMLCSALLPPLMILYAGPEQTAARVAVEAVPTRPAEANEVANRFSAPAISPGFSAVAPPETMAADPAGARVMPAPSMSSLLTAWVVISGAMLAFLTLSGLLLLRRSKLWQYTVIHGREVLVSADTGPALLGALRPQIVVPRWFMDEPADTQMLILEHEQQHIAARDPLLLRLATLIAIAAPWNLPLWWQLRRLRLAIELDCDARVMRGGAEPKRYGEVLLEVTQRAAAMPAGVIAMSEPASALEKRIRGLAPARGRHAVLRMIGAMSIAVAGIGAAAGLDVPSMQQVAPAVPAAATAPSMAPSTTAPPATGRAPQPASEIQRSLVMDDVRYSQFVPDATVNPAGNPRQQSATAPQPGVPAAGKGMEMRDLIALAGKKFQKRFVVNPRVLGMVDIGTLDTDSLTYHAFLEILGVHGFAAVPSGDVVTIIPEASARTVASPVFRIDNIQADDAEVVTVLIPVNGDGLNMSTIVRTLVGQAGQILAMPDGKTLLVVDKAGNVKRIAAVVQAASKPQ